jgi:hypothetical protein
MVNNNNLYLEQIEDWTVDALSQLETVERDRIIETVRMFSKNQLDLNGIDVSDDQITKIVKMIETRLAINMPLGVIFAKDYHPWLDDQRENIDWYYWNRYKRLLKKKGFPPKVVTSIDSITNKITDHLENPQKEGAWDRRGLVVGHVQSGKTANYIGVITKAADTGYRVIIVLAGLLNSLRSQTQGRIDEGFTGVDSSRQLEQVPLHQRKIGVGHFDQNQIPITFTTVNHDFSSQIARQIGAGIGNFTTPIVLIIKKHKRILENLITWLQNNNYNFEQFPFLLIDDEADHASINTNQPDADATAINTKIRELLNVFPRSSYLGYTATPFANVFIESESENENIGDDLFPRDFILSLDPPDNYVGPSKIFNEKESECDMIREIDDVEDIIPMKHRSYFEPTALPESLKEAIRIFILAKAIRILRNQKNRHNSMLINVSRFTKVQTAVKILVLEYIEELRNSIGNHSGLTSLRALEDRMMREIHDSWKKEFSELSFEWDQIQSILATSVSPIGVIEVNSSRNSETLSYDSKDYPNGRNVIAVGGLSLSRGLTLEGLTVSYFYRNSKMYDTLMQMGRWFGYRSHYEDVCRVYMPDETISWYSYISSVIDELRGEFKRMEKADLTPKDFGLCVRSHPESLIVTARNKMRSGMRIPRQISLFGRGIETSVLSTNDRIINDNKSAANLLISRAAKSSKIEPFPSKNLLFKSVDQKTISDFIRAYENHPASYLTESVPVLDYISKISGTHPKWDVLLISSSDKKSQNRIIENVGEYEIRSLYRTVHTKINQTVSSDKRRFGSASWEKAGFTSTQLENARTMYGKDGDIPGRIFRAVRTVPLLMIYLLDCYLKNDKNSITPDGIIAWAISFPGEAGKGRPETLVEYIVNTVWWNNEYGSTIDEEDIDE